MTPTIRSACGVLLVALGSGVSCGAFASPLGAGADSALGLAPGEITATNQLEYSYGTASRKEIVEDWLDLVWSRGDLRAGILFNHQAPSEEGARTSEVRHRFAELSTHGIELRAGHFYGMFGRGLLFAAREDRIIRVDTALDGLLVRGSRGALSATAFTGTPAHLPVDVRGLDAEARIGESWSLGGSGLTWRPDQIVQADGSVHREWVMAPRVTATLPFGGLYVEYGVKRGWDFEGVPDQAFQRGRAFYGSLQLFGGPLGLVLEAKDYHRFAVLRAADGRTPINNPPSLTREHLYTLLNRAPHNLDADNERGQQAELTWQAPGGWGVLMNGSRTEQQDGTRVFEELYGQLEQEALGAFRARGGFGYRESEGLRQTVVGELGWHMDERRSLTLEAEHQHVRMGGGTGFSLGAYDEQFLKLELGVAPAWSASGILELNNKYPLQRAFGEKEGPFPAAQIAYTTADGARLALWAGKRQAGYLCAGGVCKYEPAFQGVELTASLRY